MNQDERAVMQIAYRHAITNPHMFGDFSLDFLELPSGYVLFIHEFRFGFARFAVGTCGDFYIVLHLELDWPRSLAAE